MNNQNKRQHSGIIKKINPISDSIIEIAIEFEKTFHFEAGQYIWLKFPLFKNKDNQKGFYIFRQPAPNQISILLKKSGGAFQEALIDKQHTQKTVIAGPFESNFSYKKLSESGTVMIADQAGLAPFYAIIEEQIKKGSQKPCVLIFVSSSESELALQNILKKISLEHNWFKHVAIGPKFSGEELKNNLSHLENQTGIAYWVSGNQDLSEHCHIVLEESNVSNDQILNDIVLFQAIQNSTNHTIITDIDGFIIFANKAAEKITGYSSE